MTYGNHRVVTFYTRIASRGFAAYVRGFVADTRGVVTNVHGDGLTDIYVYSRWLCENSRFLYGFRGSTTVITSSTVLIYGV